MVLRFSRCGKMLSLLIKIWDSENTCAKQTCYLHVKRCLEYRPSIKTRMYFLISRKTTLSSDRLEVVAQKSHGHLLGFTLVFLFFAAEKSP